MKHASGLLVRRSGGRSALGFGFIRDWGCLVAVLKSKRRDSLPSSEFGLPGSRKYPMPDKAHAANAKARATQMENKGQLSPGSAAKIRAKANRKLGDKRSGEVQKSLDGLKKAGRI